MKNFSTPVRKSLKLLALLPPVFLGLYILKYGVEVPYLDEWDTPGNDLVHLVADQLTLRSLVTQHNEHRPFFPRLIFLGLAQLGFWNVKRQMWISLLWGSLTYWNIYQLLTYTTDASLKTAKWLGLCCMGMLIFAFSQRENWLWGLQMATFIPFLAVTTCTNLAYAKLSSLTKFLGAGLACTISTFSFANGLLTWVVVPPILLWSELTTHKSLRRATAFLAAWIGLFSSNIWLYFRDYVRPGNHPTYAYALQHPLATLAYFLSWLGGPLGKWLDFEGRLVIGLLFFLVFATGLALCYRHSRSFASFLRQTIGWQTFAAYAIMSGTVTTLGRVGFGVEQSLSGRYVTFATPFYISLVGLMIVLAGLVKRSPLAFTTHHFLPQKALRNIAGLIAAIALISFTLSNIPGFRWGYVSQLDRNQGKTCLMFIDQIIDSQCLEDSLYPHYTSLAPKADLLMNAGVLNIPRLETPFPADLTTVAKTDGRMGGFVQLTPAELSPTDQGEGATESAEARQGYVASGWVQRTLNGMHPAAVILAYQDPMSQREIGFRIAGLTPQFANHRLTRDVKKIMPDLSADRLIWTATFADAALPASACNLSAWAFDLERSQTWPLSGNFSRCDQ